MQMFICFIYYSFCLSICFDSLRPSQQFFSHVGLNQYWAEDKVFESSTQNNAPGESRTRKPSISSQALYRWAIALPTFQT